MMGVSEVSMLAFGLGVQGRLNATGTNFQLMSETLRKPHGVDSETHDRSAAATILLPKAVGLCALTQAVGL